MGRGEWDKYLKRGFSFFFLGGGGGDGINTLSGDWGGEWDKYLKWGWGEWDKYLKR